jgi:hypothetical protein
MPKLHTHDVLYAGANYHTNKRYARFVNDDLSIIIMTNTEEANPGAIVGALSAYYFRSK